MAAGQCQQCTVHGSRPPTQQHLDSCLLPFPKPKAGLASWGSAEGHPRPDTSPRCSGDVPRSSRAPLRVSRPLGPSGGALSPALVDNVGSQSTSKGAGVLPGCPLPPQPLELTPQLPPGATQSSEGHGWAGLVAREGALVTSEGGASGWDGTGVGRRCRLPPLLSPASPAPS